MRKRILLNIISGLIVGTRIHYLNNGVWGEISTVASAPANDIGSGSKSCSNSEISFKSTYFWDGYENFAKYKPQF